MKSKNMKSIDFWQNPIINFWEDVSSVILNEYNNPMSFRCSEPAQYIPLYGIHIYPEEYEFGEYIYDTLSGLEMSRWKLAMSSNPHGFCDCPDIFEQVSTNLRGITVSSTALKCNHHYFTYNQKTNKNILEFDRIVELGGGCGDMAKFIRMMGFKGEYTIIDLPELSTIQGYNLQGYDVNFTSSTIKHSPNTLFISTWALSECPLDWRNEVISELQPEHYLITYQEYFENISNRDYFSSWEGIRVDIPWIPWDGGSKYLIK
jgi:hypothetical protein